MYKDMVPITVDVAKEENAITATVFKDAQISEETSSVENLWDYEEILNILGFGKTQWILLLISGLLTMTSMSAQLSLGVIIIVSKCEFNTSQWEMGLTMTACVTGIVLSTYIWGYISDIWGRRTVLLWSIFVANFLQIIMMFITNIWLFNFTNLIMGISLGGITGVIYPYLGEFTTAKNRAMFINYSTMFVGVTSVYVPAISWLILSSNWSFHITPSFVFRPWRLIILLSLLPGFIGGLMLLPFPESPKLLLAHNQHAKALKALGWISTTNKGLPLFVVLKISKISLKPEELAVEQLSNLNFNLSLLCNIWKSTKPLFYKPHGLNFILAIFALFGMMFCSVGLQVWFPEIVNRSTGGLKSGEAATVCRILEESYNQEQANLTLKEDSGSHTKMCDATISTQTYIDNIIMGFAFLIGFILQGLLLKACGRKNVLLGALSVGAFSSILIYFVTDTTEILMLFCLCILIPGLTISIMCSGLVDLVPTHLRGKAVSMGFTLGRLGVILSSNLIGAMLQSHCDSVFNIVAATLLVCGGLVYFLPI